MALSPPNLFDNAAWQGKRVGLLGGSFNPPHEGHVHISTIALKALKLDAVWWLVTPHNPLKDKKILAPYDERLKLCFEIAKHPKILVSDIEQKLDLNRTYDTIREIKKHYPKTDFALVAGTDNANIFHEWYHWKDILKEAATVFVARPPSWSQVENSPLKSLPSQNHVYLDKAEKAPLTPQTTYWVMKENMIEISSTEIRNRL